MQNTLAKCGATHAEGLFAFYLKRIRRRLGEYALLSFIAGHRLASSQNNSPLEITK
jgi:hypothetical protein